MQKLAGCLFQKELNIQLLKVFMRVREYELIKSLYNNSSVISVFSVIFLKFSTSNLKRVNYRLSMTIVVVIAQALEFQIFHLILEISGNRI